MKKSQQNCHVNISSTAKRVTSGVTPQYFNAAGGREDVVFSVCTATESSSNATGICFRLVGIGGMDHGWLRFVSSQTPHSDRIANLRSLCELTEKDEPRNLERVDWGNLPLLLLTYLYLSESEFPYLWVLLVPLLHEAVVLIQFISLLYIAILL